MRTRSAFTVTGLFSECIEYAAIRVACHYCFHRLNRGAVDLKLHFLMPSTPTAMISTVDSIVCDPSGSVRRSSRTGAARQFSCVRK